MGYNIGMVSLGCAKNQLDAEIMLGLLDGNGHKIVASPEDADIIIVNTCGFIESAKQESIDTILEMAEYKKEGSEYFLRLFIDKEGGVTIEDCENVSREISPLLDNLTFIKEAYIFEVSSPGIDRALSRDWHFEKAMGKEIDIKLFAPVDGKKEICGTLTKYDAGAITVDVNGKEITIEKGKAASVRLAYNF